MTPDLLKILALPAQYKGKEIIVESRVDTTDTAMQQQLLQTAILKLKDVNKWHRIMGQPFATFQLTDSNGTELKGDSPQSGMHFRIDIAGPGSSAGQGFDWVRVVRTLDFEQNNYNGTFITVQPSDNPTSSDNHTAHFYEASSSSTFLVYSDSTGVCAMVIDRNIAVNTDNGSIADSLRNTIFGGVGKAAFSKIQWKLLADAFLGK